MKPVFFQLPEQERSDLTFECCSHKALLPPAGPPVHVTLLFGATDTTTDRSPSSQTQQQLQWTDLRSVSQQRPQRIRRQGLDSGELERVRLLSVESDVLAALVVAFQPLATVQPHQIPRSHPPQDLTHRLHLPVRQMTCRTENTNRACSLSCQTPA